VVGLEGLEALVVALEGPGALEVAPGAWGALGDLVVAPGALEGLVGALGDLEALVGALGVLGALPSLCFSSDQDTAPDHPDTHGYHSAATASPSEVRRIVEERGHDVKPFCTVCIGSLLIRDSISRTDAGAEYLASIKPPGALTTILWENCPRIADAQ
jgi:hypothetical protein